MRSSCSAAHALALTRTLETQGGSADFGNWTLPLLAARLSHDQAGQDALGAAPPRGARGCAGVAADPVVAGRCRRGDCSNLSFTLGTQEEPLSDAPTAPNVLRPVFAGQTAVLDAARHRPGRRPGSGPAGAGPQAAGPHSTGLPWVAAGLRADRPRRQRATRVDNRGRVLNVRFADGVQWLVGDAGVALVGSADPEARLVLERDSGGRIDRASSAPPPAARPPRWSTATTTAAAWSSPARCTVPATWTRPSATVPTAR